MTDPTTLRSVLDRLDTIELLANRLAWLAQDVRAVLNNELSQREWPESGVVEVRRLPDEETK